MFNSDIKIGFHIFVPTHHVLISRKFKPILKGRKICQIVKATRIMLFSETNRSMNIYGNFKQAFIKPDLYLIRLSFLFRQHYILEC